jgi:hypothetical protein
MLLVIAASIHFRSNTIWILWAAHLTWINDGRCPHCMLTSVGHPRRVELSGGAQMFVGTAKQ